MKIMMSETLMVILVDNYNNHVDTCVDITEPNQRYVCCNDKDTDNDKINDASR